MKKKYKKPEVFIADPKDDTKDTIPVVKSGMGKCKVTFE